MAVLRRVVGRPLEPVPVLFGDPPARAAPDADELWVDIFGSVFFMLTRYEEMVIDERDEHGRFPAACSVAARGGFLERPIVNEYVEGLWQLLQRRWARLVRKPRSYRLVLSHDVDIPLAAMGRTASQIAKAVGADTLLRRDPARAMRRWRSYRAALNGMVVDDPYDTFDFIMDTSEQLGVRSSFNFIPRASPGPTGSLYSLEEPWIRRLLTRIADRGHEIGFHPSYGTYRDAAATAAEFDALRAAADAEGIQQSEWGGRQHYLCWENPATWQNWDDAGLSYDSTLSFADRAGFRSGVCYRYPAFNLLHGRRLRLEELPLHVMEKSLFAYMELSPEEARARSHN